MADIDAQQPDMAKEIKGLAYALVALTEQVERLFDRVDLLEQQLADGARNNRK